MMGLEVLGILDLYVVVYCLTYMQQQSYHKKGTQYLIILWVGKSPGTIKGHLLKTKIPLA